MARKLLILFILLTAMSAMAQNPILINVRGKVFDNESLNPLVGANIRLLNAEGKMVKGAMTKDDGQYILMQIPSGTYNLRVSYIGYKEQTMALKLPEKAGNMKVNDIMLREDSKTLSEIIITAKPTEMIVEDDTLVYNAGAFVVPEGSVLEELIKKLPGVEQDENGNYTLNGKPISELLVDGKRLFGNNMNALMKNLPSDIVDKVKAYEKKSDFARITGIDDGNEITVLDLKIKKDKKKGWLGDANVSFGTHDNNDFKINASRFVDDRKVSIVGNTNSSANNGKSSHQSLGMSFNRETKELQAEGTVNANFSQEKQSSETTTQNFENPKVAFSNRTNSNRNNGKGGDANFKMEWKPDTLTNIQFQPHFSLRRNSSSSRNHSASFSGNPFMISGITEPLEQMDLLKDTLGVNQNIGTNNSKSYSVNGDFSFQANRRLGKAGRNITLNLGGAFGRNSNENSSFSQIDYYQILAYTGADSIYSKIQYDDSPQNNHRLEARLSYAEPIGYKTYLQFSYNIQYRYQNSDRKVASIFSQGVESLGADIDNYRRWEDYAQKDEDQCKKVENRYYDHDIRLQLRINRVRYRLTAGVNIRPQDSKTSYSKGGKHYDLSRNVVNWSPTLNFRYLFSKQESLKLKYNGSTGQPNILDLVPDTLNNASPLNIRLGNAELKPSFSHNVTLDYQRYIRDKQRSITVSLKFHTTQNGISNRTEYNEQTGGRVSRPENINGNWNAQGNFNFNTAVINRHFTINSNTAVNYTNAVSYVYKNDIHQTLKNTVATTNITQKLRGRYRSDNLECSVGGSFRYHHSNSEVTKISNPDTYTFSYGADIVYKTPWDMSLSTDINEHCRRGYTTANMNTNELTWNLRISQSFLKKKAASIGFEWFDILSQRTNFTQRVTASQSIDIRTQNISSYCMFNFKYRFKFYGI